MVEPDGGKFGGDQFYQTAQKSATQKIISTYKKMLKYIIVWNFLLIYFLDTIKTFV